MPIFYTDTGSLGRLEVTGSTAMSGSSNVLHVKGSGSAIMVVSGSTGGLMEVSDIGAANRIFSLSSGSIEVLSIDRARNLALSGSASVSGSVSITGSLSVTGAIAGTFPTNIRTHRFEIGVSSTTIITIGAKGRKAVSYAGTIVGWRLVADQSTTTTLDIWKANGAIPTNTNSITGTAKPSLTAAQLNSSTTLTGWTTSVADGDIFILEVESNNNANYISLELEILLNNS
jgi:hypothetical protein